MLFTAFPFRSFSSVWSVVVVALVSTSLGGKHRGFQAPHPPPKSMEKWNWAPQHNNAHTFFSFSSNSIDCTSTKQEQQQTRRTTRKRRTRTNSQQKPPKHRKKTTRTIMVALILPRSVQVGTKPKTCTDFWVLTKVQTRGVTLAPITSLHAAPRTLDNDMLFVSPRAVVGIRWEVTPRL